MEDKQWNNYKLNIDKRVDKLIKNSLYFEVIFLFSNILETEIKHLIQKYQGVCQHILNNENIKFYPKRLFNTEKATLGRLQKYVSSFIKDKKTLNGISSFNRLRIKVVHKLLDQELDGLENQIKVFIPEFYRLMEDLTDKEISIMQNLRKYEERLLICKYKSKNIKKSKN